MGITMALAGDTMLGRGVGERIAHDGPYGLFAPEIRAVFAAADLRLLNLECCVSGRGRPWRAPGKPFFFRAPPEAARVLAELDVDCVTLANNHALDFGYDALADTLRVLAEAGIQVAGAGMDLTRARTPTLLEVGGTRVAVLAVTDHPADFAAGPDRPGVAYTDLSAGTPEWLTALVRDLSDEGRLVVVMPHWGPNMTTDPLPYVRSAAGALVDAGATVVAGTSAHLFHGVAGRILYDLGDLIDDYAVDGVLRNDLGLLFLVTTGPGEPVRVEGVPLRLEYARTVAATGTDRAWIRDRFTAACADLGTAVEETGGRLIVRAP